MMSSGAWAKVWTVLAALALGVAACETSPATQAAPLTIPLTVIEGNAFWLPAGQRDSIPFGAAGQVSLDDQVWTAPGQSATVQLPDGSTLRLAPDSRLMLRRPFGADPRPVIRLLSGQLDAAVQTSAFIVEGYREIPVALRIALTNMILDVAEAPSEFSIGFDGDTLTARVERGVVRVRTSDAEGTLQAQWRAALAPDSPLQIIPPVTPTPTPSRTPVASPTSLATATATPTPTPSATSAAAPPRLPSATPVIPTNTPGSGPPKPKPPTNTPLPPPPTNTPLPPPTNTPAPPNTPTSRPTAEPPTNTPVPPLATL